MLPTSLPWRDQLTGMQLITGPSDSLAMALERADSDEIAKFGSEATNADSLDTG